MVTRERDIVPTYLWHLQACVRGKSSDDAGEDAEALNAAAFFAAFVQQLLANAHPEKRPA